MIHFAALGPFSSDKSHMYLNQMHQARHLKLTARNTLFHIIFF